MTQSRIKASLLIVFILILFSCSTDARELVVKERFIYNRVIAHYYAVLRSTMAMDAFVILLTNG